MARGNKATERKTGVAAWNESVGIASREESSRQRKAESDKKRRVVLLAILAGVCIACIVCLWPINKTIERGLWLKDGTAFEFAAANDDGSEPSTSDLESSTSIVARRLASLNAGDPVALKEGSNAILVEFPTYVEDAEKIAKIVGGKGEIELIRVDEIGDADALAKINAGTSDVSLAPGTYTPFLDSSSITSASVTKIMEGYYAVTFNFNDEGKQAFADVTKELAEDSGSIAVAVDGRVLSTPSVSEEISTGQVSISGMFSENEVGALKSLIDTGELPLTTSYEGNHGVGAYVGQVGKWAMVCLAVVMLVAVAVASYVRCKRLALVIAGALAVYGILLLGLMALASRLHMYALTMPGVLAAFIGAAATTAVAWSMCDRFRAHVLEGGSFRGAAISCVGEGIKPFRGPIAVYSVVSLVFLFLPVIMLRDFGTTAVLSVVCGILSIGWYAVTALRLFAADAIKAHPEQWGVEASMGDDAK
ncbi:MAG: hypothetical protein Q4A01_05815 [Coriobacteriales bacterium]|nr:hypothetical protein [Coriobacteriales bacterium]